MENESVGIPSEVVPQGAVENGKVSSVMANFPEIEVNAVKDDNSVPANHVKVNGESSIEDNSSDDLDSSDCDALVIDESVGVKKKNKSKPPNLPKKGFKGFSKLNQSEVNLHSNPYFNESLYELSQLHQHNHIVPSDTHCDTVSEHIKNYENVSTNEEGSTNFDRSKIRSKPQDRKGKGNNPKLREYAQYLGLQPTVQFKCSKCGQAGFPSLTMLNDHHMQCTAQAPAVFSAAANSSSVPSTNFRVTRQVYLCCACGTYYENWNLFLHMREVHKRFICLYCLGMFSFSNDLSQHLIAHHNCVPGQRTTLEDFLQLYKEPCFLMCCDCEQIFSEQDNFFNHTCVEMPKNWKCTNSLKASSKCGKNNKLNKLHVAHVTGDMPNTSTAASTEFEIQSVQTEVFERDKDDNVIDIELHDKVNPVNITAATMVNEEVSMTTNETEDKSNESVTDVSRNCQTLEAPQSILDTGNEELHSNSKQCSGMLENAELPLSEEDISQKFCETVKEAIDSEKEAINFEGQLINSSDLNTYSQHCETAIENHTEPEDTRKVPKVTLKLPKPSTYSESLHEDSDDSGKLTMEVDQIGSDNELTNNDANASNEAEEKMETSLMEPLMQIAGLDVNIVELKLEQPLDKFDIKVLLQKCLKATIPTCIYCNHAKKIAVNGKQLGLHAIAEHRFSAIVNSITAEELIPESFVTRIKEGLLELEDMYFNIEATANEEAVTFSHVFECFQCRFSTTVHKELYLHNRKSHAKTILLCIMCKSNFYSYSELICHLCPGLYALDNEVNFRCCMCVNDDLPSAFRLMVHLRKRHHVCDVCLEMCHNQSRLSNHVWKHKLHHLCYRCGIAYRNKPDITKHLFWKHGTESVLCKKCLQKKWPHVYHFCIPPVNFVCEECNLTFTKAVSLKVHKRIHSNEKPHSCTFEECTESFVSKKLLLKHEFKHREPQEMKESISLTENVTNVSETEIVDTINTENENEKTEEKPVEKPKPKVDVYDLPALNLSESDSSDSENESDKQKVDQEQTETTGDSGANKTVEKDDKTEEPEKLVPEEVPLNKENLDTEAEVLDKPAPVIENIWDDFKNYQAQIGKLDNILSEPEKTSESPILVDEKPDCLDIIMKEHDYYVIEPENTDTPETMLQAIDIAASIDHDYCSPTGVPSPKVTEAPNIPSPTLNKKKSKTPRKKNSNSSSSNSSSDSESSSCTCGSNCSCSSSSGSSSSSSDSSESDSSTSEGRRRQQACRASRKQKSKNKPKEKEGATVDVLTSDKQSQAETVLETPIQESDLETTESETDEEFYDKQPQKFASKLLAEKRNQLLAEIGPLANGTLLENSRPSTPSLPEEVKTKKKSKSKKRKKKKSAKYNENVRLSNIPVSSFEYNQPTIAPLTLTIPRDSPVAVPSESLTPSVVFPNTEQAFSNSTDSDPNLRASKRRRVPNKFYGYSSEEDQEKHHPQPKWRKADLPSPARQVANSPLLVPPITIKNIQPTSQPLVEPISIRATSQPGELCVQQQTRPVQHPIRAPPIPQLRNALQELDSGTESNDSSSDEGTGMPMIPRKENQPALYCYCRCPYDEVSEMIGCDSSDCAIEWFHFECVGIMVPPKGQWFCPDCRKKKQQRREAMQM